MIDVQMANQYLHLFTYKTGDEQHLPRAVFNDCVLITDSLHLPSGTCLPSIEVQRNFHGRNGAGDVIMVDLTLRMLTKANETITRSVTVTIHE